MLVYILGGGGVILQKALHGFGVLLGKLAAHHDARRHQTAAVVQLVPLGGQIQRHAQTLHLGGGDGHIGLGQHGHGLILRLHQRHHLGGLALPFHGQILFDIQTGGLEQVGQVVFRRGALAGGVDGFALQVGQALDALAALFHHIQYAQGVDGHQLQRAVGLAVQHGGQVDGHGGDIDFALNELGGDFIGGAGQQEIIAVGGLAVFAFVQQLHQTHGGGAL